MHGHKNVKFVWYKVTNLSMQPAAACFREEDSTLPSLFSTLQMKAAFFPQKNNVLPPDHMDWFCAVCYNTVNMLAYKYTASNGRISGKLWIENDVKGNGDAHIEVLFQHLPGGT